MLVYCPPFFDFKYKKTSKKQEARKNAPLFLLDFTCDDRTEKSPQTAKAAIYLVNLIIAISTKKSRGF